MKNKNEQFELFAEMMEANPTLFYDTTELDGMENNEVTQKTLPELDEEIFGNKRISSDLDWALGDMRCYGHRDDPVYAEIKEASIEFRRGEEKMYHIEWNIVDIDESHIYVTNKTNGNRYHIFVAIPATLYVDVYRIEDDGTEVKIY